MSDPAAAEETARRLAEAGPVARMRQADTYFRLPDGRLKLREVEEGGSPRAELTFYRRPDETGPKKCEYEIAPVAHPAEIKRVLAAALGVRALVEKRRAVYLRRNVRIHLDRVDRAGDFIELEAVMPDGAPDEEGEALVRGLMAEFALAEADLVEGSYVDLVEGA